MANFTLMVRKVLDHQRHSLIYLSLNVSRPNIEIIREDFATTNQFTVVVNSEIDHKIIIPQIAKMSNVELVESIYSCLIKHGHSDAAKALVKSAKLDTKAIAKKTNKDLEELFGLGPTK